ncbi:fluoride export protein 1 [[Candida] railenensis]|uniref:Fluoride export protein 1 n=1 Tax=[Candida] railenensis TaxID=45579 RepID=A0A9P0VZG8_9ASCO|nr:fluoride export protein 1 [[Candida] railenensis]
MELTTYSGTFLGGVIWANFGACMIMGFVVQSSHLWKLSVSLKYASKAKHPLYIGLGTGFCGTFSSFSTVILEAFEKAANVEAGSTNYHYPTAGYGIMEFLAVILAHLGTSILAFNIGKHICEAIEYQYPYSFSTTISKIAVGLAQAVGIIAYIVVIVLIATKRDGDWRVWTFSCLFAPSGAILRYFLSIHVNPMVKGFPMGTFAANLSGTLVLAILTLVVRGKVPGSTDESQLITNVLHCQVITGVDDGFCGALTTVSTFVSELDSLKTKQAYKYGALSILSSFCLVVVTLGAYNWSVGLTDPVC